jgi:hypothetical protein
MDRQLHVEALVRVGLEAGEVEGVRHRRVEAGLRAATAVVVLTDEHRVREQDDVAAGRRMHHEAHVGEEVALVVAVEVDLEGAADVRFVVRVVVERLVVDFDRAVVAGRIHGGRLVGADPDNEREQKADEGDEHAAAEGKETDSPRSRSVETLPHRSDLPMAQVSRTVTLGQVGCR